MKSTRRFGVPVMLAMFGVGLIVGCGGKSGEDGTSSGRRFLKLGTAPIGGAFQLVGGALVDVVNQHKPSSVGKFSAAGTKGSQQNIRDLDSGDLDFGLANAAITYFAVRGKGAWEKPYDVKSVMTLAPNVAMFITLESSGIRTIADLKGKRVSVGPAGAGFEYFVKPLLEAHGLSYDDFSPQNVTQSNAADLLGDGALDAAFLGGAVPTAAITQVCSTQEVFFVPFDDEAKAKLIEQYPFFQPAVVPAEKYPDLTEDYAGLNVGYMHLITAAAQQDETVYQVTKTIYEHRDEVTEKHPAGNAINPKNVVRDTGTEFHPGAIRYYKEIGIWPEEASSGSTAEEDGGGDADAAETETHNSEQS